MRFRIVSLLLLIGISAHGMAAVDSQKYGVLIPAKLKLHPHGSGDLIVHDLTSNEQVFVKKKWDASSNAQNGCVVSLVAAPFTHGTSKRDARMAVTMDKVKSGIWTIDVPVDQTDYAAAIPDEVAEVQLSCVGPGKCTFLLEVTFITDDVTTLYEGDYETTVVGTISVAF